MASETTEAPAQGHYATANGLSVYYEEHGAGYPLLLLQQGFDTHEVWRFALPAWQQHFRTISPDGRGLGRTDYPGGTISYELLAQDAIAFVRTLGLQKPLICGFADGACIALQMAIWEPDLAAAYVFMSAWLWNAKAVSKRGLVLMQDFFGIEQPVREQLTEHDLEGVENKHSPAIQYLQEGYPDGWDRTYWKKYLTDIWPAWSTLTEHGADELQRIVAPSLVVVGDRDPFIPLHETVEFFQHLPNAELAVVPGTGHEALSTDHAPRVSRIILDFLQRQR
jgi:pimeloyl-ACP methyl ester carboxylesterase